MGALLLELPQLLASPAVAELQSAGLLHSAVGTVLLPALVGLAFCVFGLLVSEFALVRLTSSLALSIFGVVKELLTIGVAAAFLGERLTVLNLIGGVLGVLGVLMYHWSVHLQEQAEREAEEAEEAQEAEAEAAQAAAAKAAVAQVAAAQAAAAQAAAAKVAAAQGADSIKALLVADALREAGLDPEDPEAASSQAVLGGGRSIDDERGPPPLPLPRGQLLPGGTGPGGGGGYGGGGYGGGGCLGSFAVARPSVSPSSTRSESRASSSRPPTPPGIGPEGGGSFLLSAPRSSSS